MPITFLDVLPEVWLSHFPGVDDDHWPNEATFSVLRLVLASLSLTCRKAHVIFNPLLYSDIYCLLEASNQATLQRFFLLLRTLHADQRLGRHVRRLEVSFIESDLEQGNSSHAITSLVDAVHITEREWEQLAHAVLSEGSKTLKALWHMPNGQGLSREVIRAQRFRASIATYMLLRPLSHLKRLCVTGSVNTVVIAALCPNLTSISLEWQLPRAPTLTALLQLRHLRHLSLQIHEDYPVELLENINSRCFTCESLSVVLRDSRKVQTGPQIFVAAELVKKFKKINVLHLAVDCCADGLGSFLDNVPSGLKALYLHLNEVGVAVLRLEAPETCLQRFTKLEYLELQSELLLGFEHCKHHKYENDFGSTILHPSTMVEKLLPPSLECLTLLVDKLYVPRNGDDYFVQMLLPLVHNSCLLPNLQLFVLFEGPQLWPCSHCEDWYNTGGSTSQGSELLGHELDQLNKLCQLRNLTCKFSTTYVDAPASRQGKGLSLKRATKINSRRSWHNGTDDDMGLFDLLNTAHLTCHERPVTDMKLRRYLTLFVPS